MRAFTTATAFALVAATHSAASRVSPKPTTSWNTFTVSHTDGADDVPALKTALSSGNITANSTILFKKGITYNIWSALQFPTLNNVEVAIEGNLTYPESIVDVQSVVASSGFPGAWIAFTGGTNVTLRGTSDPEWGWIDAHGQQWWDAVQQTNRPHGIFFRKIVGGTIKNVKLWKPIGWCFSTSGSSNVNVLDNTILAKSDTDAFPFNTDGVDVGGTNITLKGNHIVNGDDCITIGSGTTNVHASDGYCEGGHGLSIGSLGSGGAVAQVNNVYFENFVMKDSLYAARFKSWAGGNGLAKEYALNFSLPELDLNFVLYSITWKNIAFSKVMIPIYITQNYYDQEKGKPTGAGSNETHIENMLFQNFAGTIDDSGKVEGSCVTDPCWYYVEGMTGKEVIILDLYPNTTSNVRAKDVFATTISHAPVQVLCNSTAVSNDVGFECVNGLYKPDAAGLF
ncbi:glycoside hydrolase family 28 protein [Peniophora sp. CONT]|nr:glycoside hydrolase family 28 protein [Peniophora sp. CONT]